MGDLSIWQHFKGWIGGLAWGVFLWANEMDEETYWKVIYEQERANRPQGEGADGV